MRFIFRDLVYIGFFSELCALADTRIGPLLVSRDVPYFSSVLATIGILLALTGWGASQIGRGRQAAAENAASMVGGIPPEAVGRTVLG